MAAARVCGRWLVAGVVSTLVLAVVAWPAEPEPIRHWAVIGPFPSPYYYPTGLERPFPPEEGIDLKATYRGKGQTVAYRRLTTDEAGTLALEQLFQPYILTTAYAFTVLRSASAQEVELTLTYEGGVRIWVNGQEVHRDPSSKAAASLRVGLRAGENDLLVKLCQLRGVEEGWWFRLSLGAGAGLSEVLSERAEWEKLPQARPAAPRLDEARALLAQARGALRSRALGQAMRLSRTLINEFPTGREAAEAVDVLLSAWASDPVFFGTPADYEQATDYSAQVRYLRRLTEAYHDYPVAERAQWGIIRQTLLHQYRAEIRVLEESQRWLLEFPYRPSAQAKGPESYFLRRGPVGLSPYDEVRLYGELLRRSTYPSRVVALAERFVQSGASLRKLAPGSSAWKNVQEAYAPAAVRVLLAQAERFEEVKPELVLLAARVARLSGDAGRSAALYGRVLSEHPTVERVATRARAALVEMGKLPPEAKKALSDYQAFIQQRQQQLRRWRQGAAGDEAKGSVKAGLERGARRMLRADYGEARRVFEGVVEQAPGLLRARMQLARAYQALGDPSAAAEQYRTILLIDPNHDDARIDLARLLFPSDVGLPEAVEHLQAVKDSFWNAREAKFLLGAALLRRGDYEGAVWAFAKARQLGYNYWASMRALHSARWGFDVNYYMQSGRYDEAIKLYTSIEQGFSGHVGGNPYYALKIARIYIEKGDFADARKALKRAVVNPHLDRGRAQTAREVQQLEREIEQRLREGRRPAPEPAATVAVVGFRAASGQPAQVDRLAATLRDAVEQGLTQRPGLRVLERSRVEEVSQELALAGAGLIRGGLAEIAARIRADLLVSAEVTEEGEALQVKVFLRNTRTGETATAAQVSGGAQDLFALADRVLGELQKHPWLRSARPTPAGQQRRGSSTVAVFPFANAAGIGELENLGEAMAALLQAHLATVQGVTVVSRENVGAVLEELRLGLAGVLDEATVKRVGQMLGADLFVMGSVVESGGRLRAVARVVDARSGVLLQAPTAEGPRDRPQEVEQRLLDGLLPALGLSLSPAQRQKLAAETASSLEAELLATEFRNLYWRRRRYQEARQVAEQYLHLRPNDVNMLVILAELYRDHSRAADAPEQAETLLRKALTLSPRNPQAAQDLARLLVARENYQQAIPVLERAPRSEEGNFLLGYSYEKTGQGARALQAYRRAGSLPALKSRLAQAAALTGRSAQAIRYYEEGLAQNPYDLEANYALAKLYEKAGRSEEARERYRGVIYLDPQHPLAQEAAANPLVAAAPTPRGLLVEDAPGVYLLPLGRLPEGWPARLAKLIEEKLGVRARVAPPLYDLSFSYEAPEDHYSPSRLGMRVRELWAWLDRQALFTVGLMDVPPTFSLSLYEREGGGANAAGIGWYDFTQALTTNYLVRGKVSEPQATYLGLLLGREPADFNRFAHVVLQMVAGYLVEEMEPCSYPQCARALLKVEMLDRPPRGLCSFDRAKALQRLRAAARSAKLGPETLLISDFESQADINRWVIQVGSMKLNTDRRYVTQGRGSARVTIPPGQDYPGVVMNADHGMPTDWRRYDFISLDLINPTEVAIPRWATKIYDRLVVYRFEDQTIVPEPGVNTITYPVAYLISTDRTRYMEVAFMMRYLLFHLQVDFPVRKPVTVYLDNFRLVRAPASRRPPLWMNWEDAYALRPDKAEEFRRLTAEQSRTIFDFEEEAQVRAWRAPGGELTLSEEAAAVATGRRALKVALPAGKDRYLDTSQGWGMPMDWSNFDVLRMEVTNPTGKPLAYVVEIQDLYSLSFDWDVFREERTLPPGRSTVEFPFTGLKTVDDGRFLDRRYMENLYLRFPRLSQPTTIYLDNVRLEKMP